MEGVKILLVRALLLLALVFAFTAGASAKPVKAKSRAHHVAPAGELLDNRERPFSCADPSMAFKPHARLRYTLVCTSDFDPCVYPIYVSNQSTSGFRFSGCVFTQSHHPWWMLPIPGGGRAWGPNIFWNPHTNEWNLTFAVQTAKHGFVIGIAWGRTFAELHATGHNRILQYVGNPNPFGSTRQQYGSDIDPTEAMDPATGQLYLCWAEQHSSIWCAELSADGTRVMSAIHQILWTIWPYDCDGHGSCTIEGPSLFFKNVGGRWIPYLFYSARSTWNGTYTMWAAVSTNPLHVFHRLGAQPMLSASHGWWNTGGGSSPVPGPYGTQLLPFHGTRTRVNASHTSNLRMCLYATLRWVQPAAQTSTAGTAALTEMVPVPKVNW